MQPDLVGLSENPDIKPYHYTELEKYTIPIKTKLLKISKTLQEGIGVVSFSSETDSTLSRIITLKNISK